jgi:hypothetical protein
MEYEMSAKRYSRVHSVSGGAATDLPLLLAEAREAEV